MKYSTINSHCSTLSGTLPPVGGFKIGEHPLVSRLLKGIFNVRPPVKSLFPSWEVDIVLEHLKTWSHPSKLGLSDLTKKTVFLMALVSAKRIASLANFSGAPGMMDLTASLIRFAPISLEKHNRPT